MSLSSPPTLMTPDTAVLLVLLPLASASDVLPSGFSNASIRALQKRLGPEVRVLKVDEATHPAVVRSFGTPELPACVLVRQGVELWRQQGLPEDDSSVTNLLTVARTL